jgi:putative membrane protein (TIGR04086 family)
MARRIDKPSAPPAAGGLRWGAVWSGMLFTLLCSLCLTGLLSLAVYATSLSESVASGALFYAGLLALVAGAAFASRRARGMGWMHGCAVGLGYVAVSVLVGLLVFPGGLSVLDALHRFVLGVIGGSIGGMLGVMI